MACERQTAPVRHWQEDQAAERQRQEEEISRSAAACKRAAELEAAYEVEIWKQQEQVYRRPAAARLSLFRQIDAALRKHWEPFDFAMHTGRWLSKCRNLWAVAHNMMEQNPIASAPILCDWRAARKRLANID